MYQVLSVFLATELSRQLEGWLSQADLSHGPARAIIAPYVYSFFITFEFSIYWHKSKNIVTIIMISGNEMTYGKCSMNMYAT